MKKVLDVVTFTTEYDCLLDEAFVYDMEKAHASPKTLSEKWAMFEPDVFDVDVSAEQYKQWIYE
jgi:hypothetical protein